MSSISCVATPGTTWGTSASRISAAQCPAGAHACEACGPCSLIAPLRPDHRVVAGENLVVHGGRYSGQGGFSQ
jgi:hypothetical protein